VSGSAGDQGGTDLRDPVLGSGSGTGPEPGARRSGELGAAELLRWAWRQLTSMRTALILLLLLALGAVPGSLIPQEGVDALKTSNWKDAHPHLTPVYERLGLFSVYDTPWFAAIYLLLVVSLVGCILPRCAVYWRALRARPPAAPRRLTRLPASASYTAAAGEDPLARAEQALRQRRYRVRRGTDHDPDEGSAADEGGWVAAERGYLREAGNLLFHVSVLVVLVGFALGSLFGYKGGVIVMVGGGFSNDTSQYDDFVPGSLFDPHVMEPFTFTVDSFDIRWLTSGPARGQARSFASHLTYRTSPGADPRTYDLRVNHPLTIGGTELFLIGHGYAPVITIRDGEGHVAASGPVVFLPVNQQSFESIGVVKAPDAAPRQIGLEGEFYPTYARFKGRQLPTSIFGDTLNPAVSMLVYTGDLGLDTGATQSVYALDKSRATMVRKKNGAPFRVDLKPGETQRLPGGLGSVTFEGVKEWNKIQISRSPGKLVALGGVLLALLGLLGSLFIRPRRAWVRVRRTGEGTLVDVAVLDRTGGGEPTEELAALAAAMGLAPARQGDDP
jgi:cytochrome c biogenesis protein